MKNSKDVNFTKTKNDIESSDIRDIGICIILILLAISIPMLVTVLVLPTLLSVK